MSEARSILHPPGPRRLLTELFRHHAARDVEAALASIKVLLDGDVAIVSRADGTPLLGTLPLPRVAMARLEAGVYTRTPTSHARARLLDAAAALADDVRVHVPIASDKTHRGRLAIDVPRRVARALGGAVAEPGDRFERGFAHAFFDDEAVIEEAEAAGLRFVARQGSWVQLERGRGRSRERPDAFVREVARALRLLREAERLRLSAPPERAVRAMRAKGSAAGRRGPLARARLRRAIGWVDAAYPLREANCLRRVLLEIGLDSGAAEETLVFGLDVGSTGHVAFKGAEDRSFDVTFELPPGERR